MRKKRDMGIVTKTWPAVAASLLMAAGCTVGPDYKRPTDVPAPSVWASPTTRPTSVPTSQVSVPSTQTVTAARWWTRFNDPTLDQLIDESIKSNLDVKQSEARIREARAARGITSAGLYPNVGSSAQMSRSRASAVGTGADIKPGNFYQAGFDASWEIDVFGGTRRGIEAADADIIAAVEDRRDVLVSLTAEVATNYLDLRGFQRRIAIAKNNLGLQQHNADLTRRRFDAGVVSGLDVANAEAQMAATSSQIPVLEQSARQAIYSLSVLLGKEPGALTPELSTDSPIPTTPPAVPVGLPSDLLRRRPDIRRSEAQLHAATARVGIATADLYPKFSLTGSFGTEGRKAKDLGNWDNRFWNIGPSVSWPVFDAGRIRSSIAVQNAITEQAVLTYTQTILTALADVENALTAYAKEQQHREALVRTVVAYRRALDLATRLYNNGQTDFLNVIAAQGSLFSAEDSLVQSDRTVAANLVALYKALGGGWEDVDNAR